MRHWPSRDGPAIRVIGAGGRALEQVPVPDVRSFPKDDAEFRAHVEAAIASGDNGHVGVETPAETVQTNLRARYPLVAFHAQHPLAIFPGQRPVVYAYRDGRVNPDAAARKPRRSDQRSGASPGSSSANPEPSGGAEGGGTDRART